MWSASTTEVLLETVNVRDVTHEARDRADRRPRHRALLTGAIPAGRPGGVVVSGGTSTFAVVLTLGSLTAYERKSQPLLPFSFIIQQPSILTLMTGPFSATTRSCAGAEHADAPLAEPSALALETSVGLKDCSPRALPCARHRDGPHPSMDLLGPPAPGKRRWRGSWPARRARAFVRSRHISSIKDIRN